MSVFPELYQYLTDPSVAWGGADSAQSTKLSLRLGKIETQLGMARSEVIEEIVGVARLRQRLAAPTIYIPSAGSSGSHWLQAMIAELVSVLPAGEVYLPKSLRSLLSSAPARSAQICLQAIYLAHAYRDFPDMVTAHAVNTVHVARIGEYAALDIPSIRILLIRNPVDIVISRTLRKQQYREYLGYQDRTDAEYLEKNIEYVLEFFSRIQPDEFDMVCRYEDLCARPESVLPSLARMLKCDVPRAKIDDIIDAFRADAVKRNPQKAADTNVYLGERAVAEEQLIQRARKAMAMICESFGYDSP